MNSQHVDRFPREWDPTEEQHAAYVEREVQLCVHEIRRSNGDLRPEQTLFSFRTWKLATERMKPDAPSKAQDDAQDETQYDDMAEIDLTNPRWKILGRGLLAPLDRAIDLTDED
jgi:hypothetical protein